MSKKKESKFKNYVLILSLFANIITGYILFNDWIYKQNEEKLNRFLYDFIEANEDNNPEAILDFFAYPIKKYNYLNNLSYDEFLYDRKKFISEWPQRNYTYIEKPKLIKYSKSDSAYTLITTFLYEVRNVKKIKSGENFFEIVIKKENNDEMKIISLFEFITEPIEIELDESLNNRNSNQVGE